MTCQNLLGLFAVLAIAIAGCESGQKAAQSPATGPSQKLDGSKFILAREPEPALEIIDARKTSKQDDEIVLVGRIGGSEKPWIDGMAAFTIVDRSLKACSDTADDHCPTPWDYCCETDRLPTATALVKFVDGSGRVVSTDARQLLKVAELDTVVIKGKAQRDDAGNLTILAQGLYLRR